MSQPAEAPKRVVKVQTPGATQPAEAPKQEAQQPDGRDAGAADQQPQPPQLPPDLAALVAAEVQKGVAQALAQERRARSAPGETLEPLPSADEAMKQVMADPQGRSVLSAEGWVVAPPRHPRWEAEAKKAMRG